MPSELEKMLADQPYNAADPGLVSMRHRARRLLRLFNHSTVEETARREGTLGDLLYAKGEGVKIEPPFYCDYGCHIELGDGVYMNFGCTLLDCNWIRIGAGTLLGPSVQIYAAYHPTDPEARRGGLELAKPVTIGRNVWIGGGAIILPGVTIGDDTTIGAGSVVAKDIPARVVAAGNPCNVVRELPASP